MSLILERDLRIRMRDGVELCADLYRPESCGPLPTLLHRTPYGKSEQLAGGSLDAGRLVRAGFNLVVQDVRGRFASGGVFEPYVNEQSDGADTVEWLARQAWSKPSVGMVGRSYGGATQWLAAAARPGPLRAIAPDVASADFYDGWTYAGGVLKLGFCLHWLLADLARPTQQGQDADGVVEELESRLRDMAGVYARPWTVLGLLNRLAPYYREWLGHATYDDYWRARSAREGFSDLAAPALCVGGWYDLFLSGTLGDFTGLRKMSSERVRRSSRLVVGPWSHVVRDGVSALRRSSPAAGESLDLTGVHERWFRVHLADAPAQNDEAPVRLFVMGVDEWHGYDDWPPPGVEERQLFLSSRGHANTLFGDGVLCGGEAPQAEGFDVYVFDPHDPVPTLGGAMLSELEIGTESGPFDQRPVERRDDVLCYSTSPLERPVAVVGEVVLVLYASSSAIDTDFSAKLVDVDLDGAALLLCDGILRARYCAAPAEKHPEWVARYVIRVGATANVFRSGHRIRLEVSSSNFPRFDPNPNTGGPTLALGPGTVNRARNKVFHGGRWPSHLLLPVLSWPE